MGVAEIVVVSELDEHCARFVNRPGSGSMTWQSPRYRDRLPPGVPYLGPVATNSALARSGDSPGYRLRERFMCSQQGNWKQRCSV